MEPQEQTIELPGVCLQYLDWPGEGPPLLCIHGLTANRHSWDGLARRVHPRRRVIAVDLRGRGLSDKPPAGSYGVHEHAKDMAALITALGLGPVVVVGHSLGGLVAAMLAADFPELVSRLVLIEAGGVGAGMSEELLKQQVEATLSQLRTVYPSFEAYVQSWRQVPFITSWTADFESFLAADVQPLSEGRVASRAREDAIVEDMGSVMSQYDMHAVLPRVRAPALLLWAPVGLLAPDQPLIPAPVAQEIVRSLPDGSLREVPGANHYTILLAPDCLDQVAAAVLAN